MNIFYKGAEHDGHWSIGRESTCPVTGCDKALKFDLSKLLRMRLTIRRGKHLPVVRKGWKVARQSSVKYCAGTSVAAIPRVRGRLDYSQLNLTQSCRSAITSICQADQLKLQPPPTMASTSTDAAPHKKPVAIITIGMAGSGKTTFVQRINSYLHSKNPPSPPYILNLDPAVAQVPFDANIDIRDTVNYQEVMKQYVFAVLSSVR